MFTIGLPGFLLALESNNTPISGHFLKSVLMRSLPAGITDAFIVASLTYSGRLFGIDKSGLSTAAHTGALGGGIYDSQKNKHPLKQLSSVRTAV